MLQDDFIRNVDIDTNLKYGCAILKHYMNRANGRLMDALARYLDTHPEP